MRDLKKGVKSMELTFKISAIPVLVMTVDITNKTACETYSKSSLSSDNIVAPNERNYVGLTRRLQTFTQTKLELPELIKKIKNENIHVDYQHNLSIDISN